MSTQLIEILLIKVLSYQHNMRVISHFIASCVFKALKSICVKVNMNERKHYNYQSCTHIILIICELNHHISRLKETYKNSNDFRALKKRIVETSCKVWSQKKYLDCAQTFSGLFLPENVAFLCQILDKIFPQLGGGIKIEINWLLIR